MNDYSLECLERLVQIGLVDPLEVSEEGYEVPFKSNDSYFHPKRHVPPTNPSNDMNISPVDGYTFSVCKSMQNVQLLTECGGVNKYVCKYIGKIDEQNYVVVNTDNAQNGHLMTQATFLHNTKVATSKFHEDKAREKNRTKHRPQGRAISLMEMLHLMLHYPEVYSDLYFITICSLPLELRAGTAIDKKKRKNDNGANDDNNEEEEDEEERVESNEVEDGADVGLVTDNIRKRLELVNWRQHSNSELLLLDDLIKSNISIDRISEFSVRPPELRYLFDSVEGYFRWFEIEKEVFNDEQLLGKLNTDINSSCWIDGFGRQVKLRKKALPEIKKHIEEVSVEIQIDEDREESITIMVTLFERIQSMMDEEEHNDHDDADEIMFNEFVTENIFAKKDYKHLPVPVFSFVKPTLPVHFMLHILITLGRFSTEIELTQHGSLRDALRHAKLIGPSNDPAELQRYSDSLLRLFVTQQLVFYPNSKRIIDSWIVSAGELFDSVIVNDAIPITDMPPVQLSTLYEEVEERPKAYVAECRESIVETAIIELRSSVLLCEIPSKEDILGSSKEHPLDWNPFLSYKQCEGQPLESFHEQKRAIKRCKESIDKYCDILAQNTFNKCVVLRGFPGSGKTWTMQYIALYAASKGLNIMTTAMMARRAITIGGSHIHNLFCLPTENNLSVHRCAELAIVKILRDPVKLHLLLILDVLFCDEIGQWSAETLATLDIILRKLRNNNIFMGGFLIIGTMDHTQLYSVTGRPMMVSSQIISCFTMVAFNTSVRAAGDPALQRIQQIARYHYAHYESHPEVIDEFKELICQHCTFVDTWNSEEITPDTYRLFGKKFPAKEASRRFVENIKMRDDVGTVLEKTSDDVENPRFSHAEWRTASETTSVALDKKLKEPRTLLFYRGAIFEFTYNCHKVFSHSQMGLLFDLPSQEDLDRCRKIKILVAPPSSKHITWDPTLSKRAYIEQGFLEKKVGLAPERTQFIANDIQAQRRQYGLKHRVTSTIHAAMGDTLPRVAMEISEDNNHFKLWDKAQVVVLLSRTKFSKDLVFVGSKCSTILALTLLLRMKSQWTNYIEDVLRIITLHNSDFPTGENDERVRTMTQREHPFRICDVSLPQCRTGFVYFLISVKHQDYTYIGECACLRTRIQQHNSGIGSVSTAPIHKRPFAILSFVCGFDGEKQLRMHVENQWKVERDRLISRGVNDIHEWSQCVTSVINRIDNERFQTDSTKLRLVCMFK